MKYDFTHRADRHDAGSYKWLDMLNRKPDVPADVVPLSVADMELYNPPEVIKALHELLDEGPLGYTTAKDSFYEACLSWQERHHDWTPKREWIATSPGVVPAFHDAVRILSEPGDGIIIQPPVYYPFTSAITRNGRVVVENPLVLEGDRYRIDFEGLEELARDPRNKAILLCSPHNPVARVWEPEELRRLVDICLANDVFIVSDEIHDDLIMPGHHHTTIATVMGEDELAHCMVCTAPSKTFNLAGVQCSVIYIPDEGVRERFVGEFDNLAMGNSLNIFAYRAATAAYTLCDEWLEQLIGLIQENYDLLRTAIEKNLPGVRVFPLEGTYLMWADFSCWGMTNEELERFMQQEALLFLDEGHIFGSGGDGFERFNLACPTEDIVRAGERLVEAARRYGLA